MSTRDFGLGPKWWQQPENKLKKCSERLSEWCDPTETDGCCAVIPCMYCLELEIYGQATQYGTADFLNTGWSGTVGGGSFFGFWEVGYESGECEFVVYWQGEEVYRKSCQQGQSCRDSSDQAEVVIDYEDAVLRWVKHDYRPLPYIKEPETNCTIHFCGECECTCECLCVFLSEPNGVRYQEEFCDSSYDDCLAPVWEGVIGYRNVRLMLGRDDYTGQCVMLLNVDGEDFEPIPIGNCTALSGSVVLPDYSELSFLCKTCSCSPVETYPCDCTWGTQADGSLDGTYGSWGLLEAGVDVCDMEYLVGAGGIGTLPTSNKTWQDGECVVSVGYLHRVVAFPPFCMENDSNLTSKRVIFVRKEFPGDTPNIDNSQVEVGDWYAVVYAATTDTILGIYYEFETCCHNYTDTLAASSHAVWLRFYGVMFGAARYTIGLYNQANADEYGNCGFVKPTLSPG